GVRELALSRGYKRAGVDGVAQLLGVQGNSGDVDGSEPLLDLGLGARADVHEQLGAQDHVLLLLRQRREGLLAAVDDDGQLDGDEAADGGDALLAVEHLQVILAVVEASGDIGEIDQAERVALEHRLDDGHVLLAVAVDVVALVLGLDGQGAVETVEALALELVVDKALGNVVDGDLTKFGLHGSTLLGGRVQVTDENALVDSTHGVAD